MSDPTSPDSDSAVTAARRFALNEDWAATIVGLGRPDGVFAGATVVNLLAGLLLATLLFRGFPAS